MTDLNMKRVRAAVVKRADGRCECGQCGLFVDSETGQADHMFGRGKAPTTIGTVWFLHRLCHEKKTRSFPGALHWLVAFADHCRKHGYTDELVMAENRMAFVIQRGDFGQCGVS